MLFYIIMERIQSSINLQPTLSQLTILISDYIRNIDANKSEQVERLNQLNKIYKSLEKLKKDIEKDN
jgi:hypothetical protein